MQSSASVPSPLPYARLGNASWLLRGPGETRPRASACACLRDARIPRVAPDLCHCGCCDQCVQPLQRLCTCSRVVALLMFSIVWPKFCSGFAAWHLEFVPQGESITRSSIRHTRVDSYVRHIQSAVGPTADAMLRVRQVLSYRLLSLAEDSNASSRMQRLADIRSQLQVRELEACHVSSGGIPYLV